MFDSVKTSQISGLTPISITTEQSQVEPNDISQKVNIMTSIFEY